MIIIDTHTHFYDPSRPEGVPWPQPNETALYRTVLPEHFRALAVPEGVTGTVVVEASPWVEDNQWILDLAAKDKIIVGHVGNLTPGSEGFGEHLARFAANPLYRGIRTRCLNVHDLSQAPCIADVAKLVDYDLELDLMAGPHELLLVKALSERIPELRIVMPHLAHQRINGQAPDPVWVEGLEQLADCPNVFMKVSALVEMTGQRPAPTNLEYYVPTLDTLWNTLGEDRLIYGSNWPVCAPFADYATVKRLVTEYWATKSQDAQEKFFWRNAQKAYKWVERN